MLEPITSATADDETMRVVRELEAWSDSVTGSHNNPKDDVSSSGHPTTFERTTIDFSSLTEQGFTPLSSATDRRK